MFTKALPISTFEKREYDINLRHLNRLSSWLLRGSIHHESTHQTEHPSGERYLTKEFLHLNLTYVQCTLFPPFDQLFYWVFSGKWF